MALNGSSLAGKPCASIRSAHFYRQGECLVGFVWFLILPLKYSGFSGPYEFASRRLVLLSILTATPRPHSLALEANVHCTPPKAGTSEGRTPVVGWAGAAQSVAGKKLTLHQASLAFGAGLDALICHRRCF